MTFSVASRDDGLHPARGAAKAALLRGQLIMTRGLFALTSKKYVREGLETRTPAPHQRSGCFSQKFVKGLNPLLQVSGAP